MQVFQHALWGYTLNYPDGWIHRQVEGADGFAAREEGFGAGYTGPGAGHVLIKAEWNSTLRPVEPLWNQHIGMLATMMGAKQVGSAPWEMAGMRGIETEIVLAKQDQRRLWTGLLHREFLVLKFMVLHPKEIRAQFEPVATLLIGSLRFPTHLIRTAIHESGIPLPPEASPIQPESILTDIQDPHNWRGFSAPGSISALQAFYFRECPALGWKIEEYIPFPYPSDLGFARFRLTRQDQSLTLGLFPSGEGEISADSPAAIVFRLE